MGNHRQVIPVTKTFLPPQEEYQAILKRAWDKQWITNRGELVVELEQKLKAHLGVPHLTITTNGTLPLQIAIKALGLTGEIITTPFSYVATTSSIVWEGCTPVFVDIDPEFLTIDETKIEAAITPRTSAILATHVFGNPCNVEVIEDIARRHGLKVIYDAAHCFGVTYNGRSIFEYGDVSTCSFHATKIFHTGEGGAMFTSDPVLHQRLFFHHNFGHKSPTEFYGLGINAKISEIQAALGLSVLNHIDHIFSERARIFKRYELRFQGLPLQRIRLRAGTEWNYSYYYIILETEEKLLEIMSKLEAEDILVRRYFYPSLNSLPYLKNTEIPISEDISKRIICLPVYTELADSEVDRISSIIINNI